MSAGGFEPSTNGLKGHCSAVELRARNEISERFAFYHVKILASTRNGFAFCVVCTVEEPMSELQTVSESSFQNEVIDFAGPVLVDISAVWCGPCKMLDPIVHQLAEEWQGKVKVVKLDADENPNILMQYGVLGIPTLMLFKGGELKERLTGFLPKNKLVERLSPHF